MELVVKAATEMAATPAGKQVLEAAFDSWQIAQGTQGWIVGAATGVIGASLGWKASLGPPPPDKDPPKDKYKRYKKYFKNTRRIKKFRGFKRRFRTRIRRRKNRNGKLYSGFK